MECTALASEESTNNHGVSCEQMALYDYIYVDLKKVISVYSQITGGIVEVVEHQSERISTDDNKRRYDFKVFKHDAGGTTSSHGSSKYSIKPHHALLTELEKKLEDEGYLLDLSSQAHTGTLKDMEVRTRLKNTFCVKVKGKAVIEDYERLKLQGEAFPDVVKLVSRSQESAVIDSPEYQQILALLQSEETTLNDIKDRNERARRKARMEALRAQLSDIIKAALDTPHVEQWILDGMRTWIDAFLSGIVNLRIYPHLDQDDEHVFGHLKRDCFEDVDRNTLHFTYGSMPTEELTMLGIITSVPDADRSNFDPLHEFSKDALADYESVENAFRGLFRGFDGLEQMVRTCRYPRVLLYPLTVYRSVESSF